MLLVVDVVATTKHPRSEHHVSLRHYVAQDLRPS